MLQKTLLVMDSIEMSLQLLHSDKFPFFWSFMIEPLLKSSGFTSLFRGPEGYVEEVVSFRVVLRSADLHTHRRPLVLCRSFISLIAPLISLTVIGQCSMSKSLFASLMSACAVGTYQFCSCCKCSVHLSCFAFVSVMLDHSFAFQYDLRSGQCLHAAYLSFVSLSNITSLCGCFFLRREVLHILFFVTSCKCQHFLSTYCHVEVFRGFGRRSPLRFNFQCGRLRRAVK